MHKSGKLILKIKLAILKLLMMNAVLLFSIVILLSDVFITRLAMVEIFFLTMLLRSFWCLGLTCRKSIVFTNNLIITFICRPNNTKIWG